MEERSYFYSIMFSILIVFLLLTPFVITVEDRITALEKLHNEYICLECNSLVQK